MLKLSGITKTLFILSALLAFAFTTRAESKLTLLLPGLSNSEFTLLINGEELPDCTTPGEPPYTREGFSEPIVGHKESYKEITFSTEGKKLIVLKLDFHRPIDGKHIYYQYEYPIVAEDGDEFFIELVRKGLVDFKLKEIEPKKALKKLNSGKHYVLTPVTL